MAAPVAWDVFALREAIVGDYARFTRSFTKVGFWPGEISNIDGRTDVFVSTLRWFIQAIARHRQIRPVFPDHAVTITNSSALAQYETEARQRCASL
jgi:hypothetical protein